MAFTDEELRVLKGMCQSSNWPISSVALLPLIARLEAAELCAGFYAIGNPHADTVLAWNKASGKEGGE